MVIEERHAEIAKRHFENVEKRKFIRHWSQAVIDAKLNEWRNTKEAFQHRNNHLIKSAFQKWKKLKVVII